MGKESLVPYLGAALVLEIWIGPLGCNPVHTFLKAPLSTIELTSDMHRIVLLVEKLLSWRYTMRMRVVVDGMTEKVSIMRQALVLPIDFSP